jgi:ribulose-phosphate 3-epimerase
VAESMRDTIRKICPALSVGIISAKLMALERDISLLEKNGIQILHVDVMDGHFVPQLTVGPGFIKGITTTMLKDVHLFVSEPLDSLAEYAAAGADIITIHPEACTHAHRTLQRISELENAHDKSNGILRGIGVNPSTSLAVIEPLLDQVDMVTLVAINPGFKGQKFIEAIRDKYYQLRKILDQNRSKALVCIDGGVTAANFNSIASLQPDIIVTGSAIFDSKDPSETIQVMQNSLKKT